MPVRNSPGRYGAMPKAFHWLTVVLVIAGWLLGQFIDDMPKAMHPAVLVTHIAIGTTILLLLIMRLSWRFVDPPPPPEQTALGRIGEIGAQSAHYALYALLVAIPIFGILVQFTRGHALPIFGLFEISSPWLRDRALAKSLVEIHEWLANALILVASLHGAAALMHHFVLGDRTLRRMLPGAIAREGF
jgi:cytochrome b561